MPAIVDKYIINNIEYDKRVKLTPSDKAEIQQVYKEGLFSQRELAFIYGVSRRSIQFAIDPEKLVANQILREERGGSKIYYDREANTQAQFEHRQYKRYLLNSGVELHLVKNLEVA